MESLARGLHSLPFAVNFGAFKQKWYFKTLTSYFCFVNLVKRENTGVSLKLFLGEEVKVRHMNLY